MRIIKPLMAIALMLVCGCKSYEIGYDCEISATPETDKGLYLINASVEDSKQTILSTQMHVYKNKVFELKQICGNNNVLITALVSEVNGRTQADVDIFIEGPNSKSTMGKRIQIIE